MGKFNHAVLAAILGIIINQIVKSIELGIFNPMFAIIVVIIMTKHVTMAYKNKRSKP